MSPFFAPLVSCAISCLLIRWMLRSKPSFALDHPNARSLHRTPVTRTGGIALMLGVFLGPGLLIADSRPLLLGAAVLSGISFFDDWRGLSIGPRLLAHFLTVIAAVALSFPDLPLPLFAIVILATIWMTNLYNFMDGSDGLAGGMTLFGFGFFALAAFRENEISLGLTSAAIAMSAGGFLLFNFYPAKIFMGDAGSIPLGFLAAMFGALGWQQGLWPAWLPILIFSPFIADASVTVTKRLLRGEKIWQAHREHYYQRLVRMGFGHRRTALLEYLVMGMAGASALWAENQGAVAQVVMLLIWAALYSIMLATIDFCWNRQSLEGQANARSDV